MAIVIHRITKVIARSAHTPDFAPATFVVYKRTDAAKISALNTLLVTIPFWHVKFDGSDNPLEMTAGEKTVADNEVQRIGVTSSAAAEFDGVPTVQANGTDVHTVTVKKVNRSNNDVGSGTETVRIQPTVPVPISDSTPTFVAGTKTITVGPTKHVGELYLDGKDPAGLLLPGRLRIRFRSPVGKPEAPLPVGAVLGGRLSAMTVSTATIGEAGIKSFVRDRQDTFDIEWTGTLVADMAVSGAGGLMPGAVEAANTWYAVAVIADSNGVNPPAAMFVPEASVTSPTLPAGYNKGRRLAWVRNNGGSDFLRVIQSGNGASRRYHYDQAVANVTILSGGSAIVQTPVSLSTLVPPTSRNVLLGLSLVTSVAGARARIRPTGSAVANPPFIFRPGVITASGGTSAAELLVDSARSLDYIVDNVADALTIVVLGFLDEI
jgi:hypothetical protein